MTKPSKKSPEMETFLTRLFGVDRCKEIRHNRCVVCRGPAKNFKDELSIREYSISGMCQTCQDEVFKE